MSMIRKHELRHLTRSERATYQAILARGYSHNDALNDALDGVHVEDAKKIPIKPPRKTSH